MKSKKFDEELEEVQAKKEFRKKLMSYVPSMHRLLKTSADPYEPLKDDHNLIGPLQMTYGEPTPEMDDIDSERH